MNGNEEAGTYLRVQMEDGCYYAIAAGEEAQVRLATKAWRERQIDCMLELEHRLGYTVNLAASLIVGFFLSSPEDRHRAALSELREEEWEEGFRKEHATKGRWEGS